MFSAEEKLFEGLARSGSYIAVRVGYAFPVYERNTLPERWVAHYTSLGLMMSDPVMHWLYQNGGAVRWSEIDLPDPRNVLLSAGRFGLHFGVAVSCVSQEPTCQRSIASFTRSDREFTDTEIAQLADGLRAMHDRLEAPTNLTGAELEALKMVKNGLLMKEIANLLGVSEGAVKQRLKNAKLKLKAKTGTQAATLATTFGLI